MSFKIPLFTGRLSTDGMKDVRFEAEHCFQQSNTGKKLQDGFGSYTSLYTEWEIFRRVVRDKAIEGLECQDTEFGFIELPMGMNKSSWPRHWLIRIILQEKYSGNDERNNWSLRNQLPKLKSVAIRSLHKVEHQI